VLFCRAHGHEVLHLAAPLLGRAHPVDSDLHTGRQCARSAELHLRGHRVSRDPRRKRGRSAGLSRRLPEARGKAVTPCRPARRR